MREFKDGDYPVLVEWMARRNLTAPSKDYLPPTGIIEEATACGFLIRTDTKVGILEYFASNPLAKREERMISISEILHALTMTARQFGIEKLFCNTKFDNLKTIINDHGFNYVGEFSTFYKEIR